MTTGDLMYRLDMLSEHDKYWGTNGEQYDGVTRVVKVLDKPALVGAAHKLGKQGISLEEAWYSGAANRGKVAHGRIEAFARDIPFDDSNIPGELMDQSDASLSRFIEWWKKENFELVQAEHLVASDRHRIGGRLDLWLRRKGSLGNILADVKTSPGFYPEQKLQICGYEALMLVPHRTNPTHGKTPDCWVPEDPVIFEELWIARVGKDEPGDMDAMQMTPSDIPLYRRVFERMTENHYDLKRVLARR